jgi:hypothetical protein
LETTELLKRFNSSSMGLLDPIHLVKRAIPDSAQIQVTEILPRLKDGGAYVKFTYPRSTSAAEVEGLYFILLPSLCPILTKPQPR